MSNYQYEFQVDTTSRTISFAGMDFTRFRMLNKASEVRDIMKFYELENNKVRWARAFSDKYQITPAKFVRVFNAIMMRIWVEPVKEHVNRFAYNNRRKLNANIVGVIWECLPDIEQAEKDGIYNIVPWIIHEGKTPHELKEKFGKGVWKQICKQSMTRNKFLAFGSKRFRYGEAKIEEALNLPSYLLKKGSCTSFDWSSSTIWLIKNKQITSKEIVGRGKNVQSQVRLACTFEDTKRMAKDLGKGFSINWSVDKMKDKHSEYTKLINLKRYSPVPYEHLKSFNVKQIQHKDYVATLLDSAALVHEEGEVMRHCVGMYAGSVAEGNYLVYSVTKDGKRSSTIAFRLNHDPSGLSAYKEWVFNQHYGRCNAYVEDENEKHFKELILKRLNVKSLEKAA